ncbi:MAG TPA: response regulator transcription factor [Chloroflexota bacterium]|nr:response regulator transcription factor [Chloroflexota bacterium]
MSERILLVDDEPSLVTTLRYALTHSGFAVRTATDGAEALAAVRQEAPDLVVLDVMLPGLDGFEVCRRIRAEMRVPIIMLTARDDPVDRIVGLEVGADDYVTKPFSVRELVARVKAHLRREAMLRQQRTPEQSPSTEAAARPEEILTVGSIRVDVGRRRASLGGELLPLKRREFDLLAYLCRNTGIVLTRSRLLANVWGDELDGDSRTVDVHVRRLRRHIGHDRLQTVRGVGYVLRKLDPRLTGP